MRAREPDRSGVLERGGVTIGYDVYGDGEPTVLLLPTWTVIHARFWKLQVPYLARHFRVITYDGPGNGRSSRPTDHAAYQYQAQSGYAQAVLEATGIERAVVVSLSMAANWALHLAANEPDRVAGLVFMAPTVALQKASAARAAHVAPLAPCPEWPQSAVPTGGQDPIEHWAKYNLEYWRADHSDFLWFFFGQAINEPHSTKPHEDAHGWGLETTPDVLIANHHPDAYPGEELVRDWCKRVRAPALTIHGDGDQISSVSCGRTLADLLRGDFLEIAGAGHLPMVKDPVRVNLALREFVESSAR